MSDDLILNNIHMLELLKQYIYFLEELEIVNHLWGLLIYF
jgi:hypothetical protein